MLLFCLLLLCSHPHQQLVSREFYGKGAFPGGSRVKNLPATQEKQETRIQPLGPKDPLERGMATHSSVLVRRMPWTEGLAGPTAGAAQSHD